MVGGVGGLGGLSGKNSMFMFFFTALVFSPILVPWFVFVILIIGTEVQPQDIGLRIEESVGLN